MLFRRMMHAKNFVVTLRVFQTLADNTNILVVAEYIFSRRETLM